MKWCKTLDFICQLCLFLQMQQPPQGPMPPRGPMHGGPMMDARGPPPRDWNRPPSKFLKNEVQD